MYKCFVIVKRYKTENRKFAPPTLNIFNIFWSPSTLPPPLHFNQLCFCWWRLGISVFPNPSWTKQVLPERISYEGGSNFAQLHPSTWSSLEEGDGGFHGPSGKLLFLWHYAAHAYQHSIQIWQGRSVANLKNNLRSKFTSLES